MKIMISVFRKSTLCFVLYAVQFRFSPENEKSSNLTYRQYKNNHATQQFFKKVYKYKNDFMSIKQRRK